MLAELAASPGPGLVSRLSSAGLSPTLSVSLTWTVHCGKPGRRTCMFSYEPFTAILEVPEVSPEVVWLLWVVGEALGTTSAPLKAQKPAKTS